MSQLAVRLKNQVGATARPLRRLGPKGHEFASQTFKCCWDVSGSIEKYLSSEIAASAFVFGLCAA
ncbi:MAG TPA: hypothetical protein VNJ11_08165 [Bryobacteraceae bacterium]|nr:hypothetical protein [Bryobacteraceae bacterium]